MKANAKQGSANGEGEGSLSYGDEDVEEDLSEQVFAAAHGIGQHFVEDAVVAVEEKRPRGIRGDCKTGHGQNSGQKELVVTHIPDPRRSTKSGIDAHAEDQHVQEREEKIPENERKVRRANLHFAINNGG